MLLCLSVCPSLKREAISKERPKTRRPSFVSCRSHVDLSAQLNVLISAERACGSSQVTTPPTNTTEERNQRKEGSKQGKKKERKRKKDRQRSGDRSRAKRPKTNWKKQGYQETEPGKKGQKTNWKKQVFYLLYLSFVVVHSSGCFGANTNNNLHQKKTTTATTTTTPTTTKTTTTRTKTTTTATTTTRTIEQQCFCILLWLFG